MVFKRLILVLHMSTQRQMSQTNFFSPYYFLLVIDCSHLGKVLIDNTAEELPQPVGYR